MFSRKKKWIEFRNTGSIPHPSDWTPEENYQFEIEFAREVKIGELFYKYGRFGNPHLRKVTLKINRNTGFPELIWGQGFLQRIQIDSESKLLNGKLTSNFRRNVAKKAKEVRCFSILTKVRTLDLEAPNERVKNFWLRGLAQLIHSIPPE